MKKTGVHSDSNYILHNQISSREDVDLRLDSAIKIGISIQEKN